MRKVYKLSLLINIAFLLVLMPAPKPAHAQWPPVDFELSPSSYQNGQITYRIEYRSRVDWLMTHLTFKIPLPEGTRFVKADAPRGTIVEFDGAEVTFYTTSFKTRTDIVATFVVEVTDLRMTVFTTHAWLSWQGDVPGDYLTREVSIDTTSKKLDWEGPPSPPRLQLDTTATVAEGTISYVLYPRNVSKSKKVRMQDVQIKVPLPEGTALQSAEPAPPFEASFDGREVTFSALELVWRADVEPLKVNISAEGMTDSFVALHAWATWKNVNTQVGRSLAAQEETRTTDILVKPHIPQWALADVTGDVPSLNDVSSMALVNDGQAVNIIFHVMQASSPEDTPLTYHFSIDSDCRASTGGRTAGQRGSEYWVRYKDHRRRATVDYWDEEQEEWIRVGWILVDNPPGGKLITMRLPYDLLNDTKQFCWLAEVRFAQPGVFIVPPPIEKVPDSKLPEFRQYDAESMSPATPSEVFVSEISIDQPSGGTLIDVGDTWRYLSGWAEPPSAWKTIDFNDDSWFSGPTNIGRGTGDYATDLSLVIHPVQDGDAPGLVEHVDQQSGMTLAVLPSGEDVTSVFMRRSFSLIDPGSLTELVLEIEYEGGFVAYLNGVEIARRRLGAPGTSVFYDTLASDPDPEEVDTSESIDLSNYITTLVNGTNVLAFQAHKSSNGPNISINPKLTWEFSPAETPTDSNPSEGSDVLAPTASVDPSVTDIGGKLAVPVDNGKVLYNVHIFSLPDGQDIARIPNARQPSFRSDGQRMLINREGGGIENVYEYNLADGSERQVTDAPQDWHPFYDPWGNRVVYGNSELTVGKPLPKIEDGEVVRNEKTGKIVFYGPRQPFVFVQCGLLPPHQETEPRCRDIPTLGVLIPAGQMGEIQGTHPVWTANDMIAYRGCNTWAGSGLCGIYIVPSSSTKGFSDGFIPRQLTQHTSDTPSDTKGDLIAFTSQREGNWEAYIMDLNGNSVRNLSDNPNSNDGLPTISPDGNWVAFVSDREGHWAVWVVPVAGGSAQKLFDLPTNIPWGDSNRAWINERISWGP